MSERPSSQNEQQLDPEWFKEFANFLNRNGNRKKLQEVKKIFVQAYFENIRDGMNSKEALHNAKSIALCFLTTRK
ncbi:MAG: hypothetical protein JW840_07410 [Candidatus Thermoplasmatota archaeon]|nr:hypothetical protein [Candidatus Thermoplasmatota archaeon]